MKASDWISVKDRFPELDKQVLTYRVSGSYEYKEIGCIVSITERSNGKTAEWSIGDDYGIYNVTHWQELPESPTN